MSTTIKRVALVAVAALGLGVLSVAPSQAVINADTLTLSSATAAQTTAETATATSATVTLAFLAGAQYDSASVTASLVSAPAGATALPRLSLVETTSATVDSNTALSTKSVGSITEPNTASVVWAAAAAKATSVKYKVYLGTDSMTAPATAGTYVVKLTPASVGASGALQGATAQTLTITVTAAAALDTVITSATAIITAGYTDSATADQVVTSTKSVGTNPGDYSNIAANIKVTPKNAAGTTVGSTNSANAGESFTATISGPGSLGSASWSAIGTTAANSRGRAITVKAGDFVTVYPDGTSGVATVTISSALGVVLATKTVTFFGSATSIVTTAQATVLNATLNDDATAGDVTTRPIKVVVKDAAGTSVSNLASSLRVTADTTTTVSDSYAANTCSYDKTTSAYYCTLTGVAAGKTKITVGTKTSATDTTATNFNGNSVEVRVGSKIAGSVKVTADKSNYAPGEKATITVQLYDADGLVVADGNYANIFATGGIATDFVLGSGSDTLTATAVQSSTGGNAVAGKRTYTVYMPIISGPVTFSWTTAGTGVTAASSESYLAVANQGVKGSLVLSVSNPGVDAATDAANEATDAANAATDAALAAADAADAATAAAQDASDAVAALATQVESLKAQIKTLTALVIKIQKKLKA